MKTPGLRASSIYRNSLIANNSNGDCGGVYNTSRFSNNYIGDGSCSAHLSRSEDGAPNLGALTGSPAYYPLLAGSPAINAARADYCPTTDQAGAARPIGAACDIGAHESSASATAATETTSPTPIVTPTPTDYANSD